MCGWRRSLAAASPVAVVCGVMDPFRLAHWMIGVTGRAAMAILRGMGWLIAFGVARAADRKANDIVVRRARRISKPTLRKLGE